MEERKLNNNFLKGSKYMEFFKCPVCGQNAIYTANGTAICDVCECSFIWFKEKDSDKSTLIANPWYEYVEQLGFQEDKQRQIYCGKWINFYNNCAKFYADVVKGYKLAKSMYGDNCMLYTRGK